MGGFGITAPTQKLGLALVTVALGTNATWVAAYLALFYDIHCSFQTPVNGSFYCKFFIGISIGLPSFCAAASCRDPDEDINGNELSVFIMGGSTISRNTEVIFSTKDELKKC